MVCSHDDFTAGTFAHGGVEARHQSVFFDPVSREEPPSGVDQNESQAPPTSITPGPGTPALGKSVTWIALSTTTRQKLSWFRSRASPRSPTCDPVVIAGDKKSESAIGACGRSTKNVDLGLKSRRIRWKKRRLGAHPPWVNVVTREKNRDARVASQLRPDQYSTSFASRRGSGL
jgi:hypothetical protein